jgi:hypothetical protein
MTVDEIDEDSPPELISMVKAKLLLAPTGAWTSELTQRVKGLQRFAKITVTGTVNGPTAWLIDEQTAKP